MFARDRTAVCFGRRELDSSLAGGVEFACFAQIGVTLHGSDVTWVFG